ncbi:unnamed protein product [Linum trigynum]|uniref:Uncharacterized protein n=1 Tax=Linum trigynum TaxID=586398 RepID=A0AAV2DEL2_9ROSI
MLDLLVEAARSLCALSPLVVSSEPTCLFGFDLNLPLTSNDKDIYEAGAEQADPTVKGDDVCKVDVDDVLEVEELVNEYHPEQDENTDHVQYGLDVEKNDHFMPHPDDRVDVDDDGGRRMASMPTMVVGLTPKSLRLPLNLYCFTIGTTNVSAKMY